MGECSKSCGGGLLEKTRVPLVVEAHGGEKCNGDPVVSESCNVQECPGNFTANVPHVMSVDYL